jgi:Leucine-rich repeat (LRR) protein
LPADAEKIQQAIPLIPRLGYLTSFSGINTPITDDVLLSVGRVKSLVNVDLSGTEITDVGVGHLVGLRRIASLTLADSKVTSACLKDLGELPNLEILNLSKNDISGGFEHLVSCEKLTWLVLSHVKLSDADVASIAEYPNLKRLSISTEVEISETGKKLLRDKGVQLDLEGGNA